MTDQPTNPNEFILIAAYRKVHHGTKTASLSVFKAACKNARLRKLAIVSSLNTVANTISTICLADNSDILIRIETTKAVRIDALKMTRDLKRVDHSDGRTADDFDVKFEEWTVPPFDSYPIVMLAWKDMLVYLMKNGQVGFVKGNDLVLETSKTKSGLSSIDVMQIESVCGLSRYDSQVMISNDFLLYVANETKKLVSIDLAESLACKKLSHAEHSVICTAFRVDSKGHIVSVTLEGEVSFTSMTILRTNQTMMPNIKVKVQTSPKEYFQVVGVSDSIALLGSLIKTSTYDRVTQQLTMVNRHTHKITGHLSIPEVKGTHLVIHSIILVVKRHIDFAIICNFYEIAHLVAVRHNRMQLVSASVPMCMGFMNSFIRYGDSILGMSQDANNLFVKLDVVF